MKVLLGKVLLVLVVITFTKSLFANSVDATVYQPTLTVKDFIQERDFRDAEISPNGRYLAMIWTKNKIRYVIIKDLE